MLLRRANNRVGPRDWRRTGRGGPAGALAVKAVITEAEAGRM